jgi:hypothetical protein
MSATPATSSSSTHAVVPNVVEPIVSNDTESSTETESSAAMSNDEFVSKRLDVPVRLKKRPKVDPSSTFAIHFRRRTLHCISDTDASKLKCGRKLTATYRVVPEMPSFDYHRCIDCFGSHV